MANKTIQGLIEALNVSPENVPLRLHVAELLLEDKAYNEAAEQFQEALKRSYGNARAQLGLANCYFNTEKYSAAIIIYEQLAPAQLSEDDQIRFVRCLIKEDSLQQAMEVYQRLVAANPHFTDEEIDSYLRLPSAGLGDDLDSEDFDDDYFMEKPAVKFADVGGMQRIKDEIPLKLYNR